MGGRWQFSLKAILVVIAVLSVPLAMIASRQGAFVLMAALILPAVIGACGGYLVKGWEGAQTWMSRGIMVVLIAYVLLLFAFLAYALLLRI